MLSVLFYLTVFLVVFVLQSYAVKIKNKFLQKVVILSSFLLILLVIGLRFEIGVDYVGHVNLYNSFIGESFTEIWSHGGDVGTKLIIGGAASAGFDVKFIFWVYGLLTLYPIYKINKNSDFKHLALSTLIFNLTILPACLNIMRQGAAMSFILLAFDYIRHGSKIRKILLWMIIAVILHTSALLMIPFLCVYWLSKKYNKKFWPWALIITGLFSVAFMTFMKNMFGEMGFSDYDYQLDVTRSMNLSFGVLVYNSIYYIMLALLMFVGSKEKKRKGEKNADEESSMLSLLVSGSIFEFVGSATKYLSRISYYFSIFQVLLIPEVLQNIENRKTRFYLKMISILVLVGLFIFRCYVQGYYGIIPYQSWLLME